MSRSIKVESLHPLIRYVKNRLEGILCFIDFEKDGKPIKINGFRLKNLNHWAVSRDSSLFTNIGPFSSYCNLDCDFCYEKGNPLLFEKCLLSVQEVQTRKKYFSKKRGTGIISECSKSDVEPFTNPHILEILRIVRNNSPNFMINITTNGAKLTEEMVSALSQLKPLCICLSLNSSDPHIRSTLMKDAKPETAINAVKLLREYGIPFVGSLVPWPIESLNTEDQLGRLEKDIRYLDKYDARQIRTILPGYSKYFRNGEYSIDTSYWDDIVSKVKSIAARIKTPILLQPSLYWTTSVLPYVDGVIYNSPAHSAGIKRGDLIRSIDGERIFTRTQAKNILRYLKGKERVSRSIEMERNGNILLFELRDESKESDDLYPYKPKGYKTPFFYRKDGFETEFGSDFGICLIDDFQLSYIDQLVSIIDRHNAQRTLLLTSYLVKPVVEMVIETIPKYMDYFKTRKLHLEIPMQRFWGGNIVIADLYMVQDYADHVAAFIKREGLKPDLIVIPSSFATEYGLDLSGVSYLEIENEFDVPVELLRCKRIFE